MYKEGNVNMIKAINILGYTFDIIYTDDNNLIQDILKVRSETIYVGAVDGPARKIYINTEANKHEDETLETILHECIHAIDHFMGIDLSEEQVKRLGVGIATVFKDMKDKL